ncbi:MAG: hypothetical protein M1333_01655, partial [Patescibacteria group bacterium]|nr:hypothetical protein [Patescibacteria group bacterium]
MNKSSFNLYLGLFFGSLLLGVLIWGAILARRNQKPETVRTQPLLPAPKEPLSQASRATTTLGQENQVSHTLLFPPLDKALERVTKKPFGIKISPQNSPVSPERFSGFHTGVDFETFPDEQDTGVSVYA